MCSTGTPTNHAALQYMPGADAGRLLRVQVDTHVHHSACMHQKHLLRFIKSKLRKEPDEVVIFRDGKYLTLKEVFESLNLTGCVLAAWVQCLLPA
jgi:hypothetical protein